MAKANRSYLAKLRTLRRQGTKRGIDPKVLAFLDQAISTLKNDLVVETAGLGAIEVRRPAASAEFFSRNAILA